MKFKDYEYIRPDVEKMESDFEELLAKFRDAKSSDEQDHIIEEITKLRNNLDTMHTLVSIRHSINTLDEFYEQEQNFMDENSPRFMNMVTKFYKELIKTPFRKELENTWGEQLFNLAQVQIETFSEEIMDDLVKENKLSTEYDKLIASAKIYFQGE